MKSLCALTMLSLLWSYGCATYAPDYPRLATVPSTRPLPIDGTWESVGGIVIQIENGRIWHVKGLRADSESVLVTDLHPTGRAEYVGKAIVYNTKLKITDWGTASIVQSYRNAIRIDVRYQTKNYMRCDVAGEFFATHPNDPGRLAAEYDARKR